MAATLARRPTFHTSSRADDAALPPVGSRLPWAAPGGPPPVGRRRWAAAGWPPHMVIEEKTALWRQMDGPYSSYCWRVWQTF